MTLYFREATLQEKKEDGLDYRLALKVEQLQKRIEILETYAVTDIIEEPPKYYIVKRRLDPDKNN